MTSRRRVAVVTGAGTGIGRAVALALLDDGYHVVLAGRRRDLLEHTARTNGDAYGRALVVPTDVTLPSAVGALFERTREALGGLDLLFNNAGISGPSVQLEDISFDQWTAILNVNLTGMFLCLQAAFRLMKAQMPRGGRIINNGSVAAHSPRPNSAPYAATKHAITGLTKAAALDGRRYDIACGQIDVGNAAAGLTDDIAGGILQANGTTATEPRIDVSHVARAVVYMASLPLDANVLTMTVMATKMPLVGRG